jgi:hypothetical protein
MSGKEMSCTPKTKRNIQDIISPSDEHSSGAPDPTRRRENSPIQMQANANLIINSDDTGSGTINLVDVIRNTISSQPVLEAIAAALAPAISDIVTKVIQPLNDKLDIHINETKKTRSSQDAEINLMKLKMSRLENENQKLKERLSYANEEIEDLFDKHDDLEQYGRRNSIRFHNVNISEKEDGTVPSTDQVIVDICAKMKINPPITEDLIERSHKIGKPNKKGNHQIICKFKSYKTKSLVYKSKSSLKTCKTDDFRVFITEDLTRKRQNIISSLSELRVNNKINSYWTQDGRIFFKETEKGPVKIVKDSQTLQPLLDKLVTNSDSENAEDTNID